MTPPTESRKTPTHVYKHVQQLHDVCAVGAEKMFLTVTTLSRRVKNIWWKSLTVINNINILSKHHLLRVNLKLTF